MSTVPAPFAHLGGLLATGLIEVADLQADPGALDRGGWWAVSATFEGRMTGYRFAAVRAAPLPSTTASWHGPPRAGWRSSLDEAGYLDGVDRIRRHIEAGDVYQVNLCRMLRAAIPGGSDPLALAHLLAAVVPGPLSPAGVPAWGWAVAPVPACQAGSGLPP